MDNQETSTIVNSDVQRINHEQFKMPTWGLIVVLIITFFILKTIIYIKDGERHGK